DFDNNGNVIDKNFNKTMLTGRDGYYRYYVNWFSIIANFIIVGITLLLMGVKTVKIVFNLALDRIVGTILIFTDIEEGKRAKELLTHIIATFAVLMVSVFSMNLYAEFTGWIQTQQLGTGWIGVITNLVILLGTSIALLEGPTIIQKLLGTQVDSGLARTSAGLYGIGKIGKGIIGGGKTVGNVAFGAGKFAKNVSDKTGLTDAATDGAMKMTDAYGKAAEKYGVHNLDDISNNQSDGNDIGSSNGSSNVNDSSNSSVSTQSFESGVGQDTNSQSKNVGTPQYSDIEQDMKESGYNKDSDKSDKSSQEKDPIDKYSNDNINTYNSNVPEHVDFNEALDEHSKITTTKRNDLNNSRRQQRMDGINANGKHTLNSNKRSDVIPRNFTKNRGEK
ncbi:MAG: hypothetical protein ACRC7N_14360, partial [Clostridium sp.]